MLLMVVSLRCMLASTNTGRAKCLHRARSFEWREGLVGDAAIFCIQISRGRETSVKDEPPVLSTHTIIP